MSEQISPQGRAFLVGVRLAGADNPLDIESSLEELALLADTAGLHVVGQTYQRLQRANPATLVGEGKLKEIQSWLHELGAGIVIFDEELSPRHQRVLETKFEDDVRILDRTALILDIFAEHAHSREGAIQVELAQYEYRLPRLTRQWTHLVRQAGGSAGRGGVGGVGLRGPGETQLESDRREIRRKIATLRRDLESVRGQRGRYRRQRRKSGIPLIALVGYTNAGKTTLLNRLAGADAYVADQLFATLDPLTRRVELAPSQQILLTDTVGFVQKLPHTLIAAFRATLEEIVEADILLHVIDSSHPNAVEQMEIVERTLAEELHAADVPIVRVLNKMDLIERGKENNVIETLVERAGAIPISALNGWGIDRLCERVAEELQSRRVHVALRISYNHGRAIARFRARAHIESEIYESDAIRLTGSIDRSHLHEFQRFLVGQ